MTIDFTRLGIRIRRLRHHNDGTPIIVESDDPVLGRTERGEPVYWPAPQAARASHVLVLGSSGSGKTVMVGEALAEELKSMHPASAPSLFICDPKGDLCKAFLENLAWSAPERLRDVYYLDPFSKGGFPFNLNHLALNQTPLDIRSQQIGELAALISTAQGMQRHLGVGARQAETMAHLVLGALSTNHPSANILWALDALIFRQGMKMLAQISTSERAKDFLLSANLTEELRASCASRLRSALAMSADLERLVSAPNCIQWEELLAPGKIVLLNLGQPPGGVSSLREFYANLIVRLAVDHLLSRPSPWNGHHVRLVIDEVQIVAPALSDIAEDLLTTGRSRGISLVAVSQGTTLINDASKTLFRVFMTNAPTKIIGRLSAPDAELFAREQSVRSGIDETVAQVRTRFTSSVTNLEDRFFFELTPGNFRRFRTTDVNMEEREAAAEAHSAELQALRSRLALDPNQPPRVKLTDVVKLPERKTRGTKRYKRPSGYSQTTADRTTQKKAERPRTTPPKVPEVPRENAPDNKPPDKPKPRSKWG